MPTQNWPRVDPRRLCRVCAQTERAHEALFDEMFPSTVVCTRFEPRSDHPEPGRYDAWVLENIERKLEDVEERPASDRSYIKMLSFGHIYGSRPVIQHPPILHISVV